MLLNNRNSTKADERMPILTYIVLPGKLGPEFQDPGASEAVEVVFVSYIPVAHKLVNIVIF